MKQRTISTDGNLVKNLPRNYFVSQEIYQEESERIFEKHWLCVAHRLQLEHATIRLIDIGRYSILLVRDEEHNIRAFHNVCRHRGTRLCSNESVQISKQRITCPYHAWTYDLSGALIGAPNMADQPDFDRNQYGLIPVPVEEWKGFVFLTLNQDPEAFDEFIDPLQTRLRNWDFADVQLVETRHYEVAANWKLIFQNYSECYHCPTVHPALNRLTPYKSATNDLENGAILGGPMQLEDGFETVSLDGQRVAEPFPLEPTQLSRVYYYTVFPSMFVSAHPDYVMIHLLRRIDRGHTGIDCMFFARSSDRCGMDRAVELWDQVNREDWNVCELTQLGVQSPAFRPGPYSSLETMLAAFDRHYLRCMGCRERNATE